MAIPSTAELIPITDITSGIVTLKDGSLRAVVKINAIIFELRSSDEQRAIIQQFQGFLNSVDFPFQIVVHSRRFDISQYLAAVQTAADQLTNELLKVQAGEYIRYVGELAGLANIMSKQFYVILPFVIQAPSQKGGGGVFSGMKGLFGSAKARAPSTMTPEQLAAAKAQMMQRADLIIGGLSGMGLQGKILNEEELTVGLRDLYNPNLPETSGTPTP